MKNNITNDILKIKLQNQCAFFRGTSHRDETLGEFLKEAGLDCNSTFEEIDKALESCGIKQVFGTLPMFINIADYQGADFAIGRTLTLEGWRSQAIEWATMDEYDGIVEELEMIKPEEVIDYINEFWAIHIVPVSSLSHEDVLIYQEYDRL